MKFDSFEIVIERESDGSGYFAYSPTLPGCFSNGKAIEEAKQNMREAIDLHTGVIRNSGGTISCNAKEL